MREKHGDAVGVAFGPLKVTLFSHPDVVEDILVTRNKLWRKDQFLRRTLRRPVLGHWASLERRGLRRERSG
jgi:hypothetical protein